MKENQQVEWKETWRDEYLRWICGFANAHGGVLVLGRNDEGVAVGVRDAAKLLADLPNKIRDVLGIVVDVRLVPEGKKDLIEIHVEPYPSPISYKGEYHVRTGSTKQELKGAALERFLLQKRGRHWDGVPEPSFSLRACSAAAFRLFTGRATQSGRMDRAVLRDGKRQILDNLELTDSHGLKRAACLLFSDHPERWVSGAWLKIGFFVTDDDLRYQDEVHGSLFAQVETSLDLLRTKYLKAAITYHGVQRRETLAFPDGALREALLNAIVHKDYGSGIPIQISVYDDKLVLWNPGALPDQWTLERLLGKHPSRPFNPLVANAFFRAGYIEAWGRGIQKIQRECREHGIAAPLYDFGMAGVMVTFRAAAAHVATVRAQHAGRQGTAPVTTQETAQETTQETAQEAARQAPARIVACLRANPSLTRHELAAAVGLSPDGVKYQLARLKAAGRIRRVGATKGGRWEVVS